MIKSRGARIDTNLFDLRKKHKEIVSKALNGLRITETDIDKIYTKRLRNINIMEDFIVPKRK